VPDAAPPGPCPPAEAGDDDDPGRSSRAGCSSCAVGGGASAPSGLLVAVLAFGIVWSKSRATARRFVSSSAGDRSGAAAVRVVRARHRGGRPGARRGWSRVRLPALAGERGVRRARALAR